MTWRNKSWWFKMVPYFFIIVWTISITFFVTHNTMAIKSDTKEKTHAVCMVNNRLKHIIDGIILQNANLGVSSEQHIWNELHSHLESQLVTSTCD